MECRWFLLRCHCWSRCDHPWIWFRWRNCRRPLRLYGWHLLQLRHPVEVRYDDTLDIFGSHAVGGAVGNLLTGLFAQNAIVAYDAFTTPIAGGWLDKHYIQLAYQLADSVAGFGYSFVMTTIILWIMHVIPGLRLRASENDEIIGIDDAEMGEFAYDYVGLEQEIGHSTENVGALGGAREPQHHTSSRGESSVEHEKRNATGA